MHVLFAAVGALLISQATAAQTPLKTIEDGALDRIELFVASLDDPTTRTVIIKLFDASAADLGTGGKAGKARPTAGSSDYAERGAARAGRTVCCRA